MARAWVHVFLLSYCTWVIVGVVHPKCCPTVMLFCKFSGLLLPMTKETLLIQCVYYYIPIKNITFNSFR